MKTGVYSYLLDVKLNQLYSLLESDDSKKEYFGSKNADNDEFWTKARKKLNKKNIVDKQGLAKFLYSLFTPEIAETYVNNAKKHNINASISKLMSKVIDADIGKLMQQDERHNITSTSAIIDLFKSTSSVKLALSGMRELSSMRKVSSNEVLLHLSNLLDIGNEFLNKRSEHLFEAWDEDEENEDDDSYGNDLFDNSETNLFDDLEKESVIKENAEKEEPEEVDENSSWDTAEFSEEEEIEEVVLVAKTQILKAVNYLEKYINDVRDSKTIPYGYGIILFAVSLSRLFSDIYKRDSEKTQMLSDAFEFFKYVKEQRTYVGELAFKVKWLLRLNNLGLFNGGDFFNVDTDEIINLVEKSIDIFKRSVVLWDGHKKSKKSIDKRKLMSKTKGFI